MRIGSLCSGYGGLDLAVEQVTGASTAWFCEYDKDPSRILAHHWPDVPNHGDVWHTDWTRVEPVDILTAGYPCQPFSHAGKRKGADDPRHLWPGVARAIGDLRPRLVVLENVRGHVSLGLDAVLGDLAALGYDARWGVVRASDAGAPHGRARLFICATDADGAPREDGEPGVGVSDAAGFGAAATDSGGGPLTGPAAAGDGLREPAERGHQPSADADRDGLESVGGLDALGRDAHRCGGADVAWGVYEPAIRRWEHVLGRPAPAPTEPGRAGAPRLSPRFVEWMMGLDPGHVTDVGLSRNAQLKALGNGVVPQQAALALSLLLPVAVAA